MDPIINIDDPASRVDEEEEEDRSEDDDDDDEEDEDLNVPAKA